MHSIMYRFLECMLLLLVTGVGCEKYLPKNFPRCSRDDPQLNQCLLKATDTVRPLLLLGVPSLNIPPIEPFELEKISLEQGTSSVNIKVALTNVKIHGLSKYKFDKYEVDLNAHYLQCGLYIPGLVVDGNYKVNGKVLLFPIEGDGKFNASISRIDVWFYQAGKSFEKNGKHYFRPTTTNSTIRVSDPKIYLDGLFGNNEEMSKVTTQAINDNINLLFEDMRPVVENAMNDFIKSLIAAISEEISEEELYPKKRS